ncbi:MAG: LPS assembly lipoprotein LptE [Deltaproteobacteria bacterium]|nr:LPS assembly lipoprotein LptE [Deltaproteobacteria bacterium]
MSSPKHKLYSCKLALAVVCLIVFSLLGCGYHFAGTGGQAPGDIKSIAIDVLQNNTAQIGLESVFTNAILNEFIRWKRLPIKPRKEAEGVLGGSIAKIQIREISHVDSNKTLTSRVTITLKLNLKRVETDEVLWKKDYSYHEGYVETGNSLDTALLRRQATDKISEYLAE